MFALTHFLHGSVAELFLVSRQSQVRQDNWYHGIWRRWNPQIDHEVNTRSSLALQVKLLNTSANQLPQCPGELAIVIFPRTSACGYTVKLARAKLPANAGNFTGSSQVKRPHTQFTCVTCSLSVKTGKFTCFKAARTSRRIHFTSHCHCAFTSPILDSTFFKLHFYVVQ